MTDNSGSVLYSDSSGITAFVQSPNSETSFESLFKDEGRLVSDATLDVLLASSKQDPSKMITWLLENRFIVEA